MSRREWVYLSLGLVMLALAIVVLVITVEDTSVWFRWLLFGTTLLQSVLQFGQLWISRRRQRSPRTQEG